MSKIVEVGNELFTVFQKNMPAPERRGGSVKMSDAKVASALDNFYAEAKQIRLASKIGIIARARVLRHFQQQLQTAGYAPDMVSKVCFSLLLTAFVGR